jgi:hypothetical protein
MAKRKTVKKAVKKPEPKVVVKDTSLNSRLDKLEKAVNGLVRYLNGQLKVAQLGGDPFSESTSGVEEL